jgi:hypothetical protein
VSEYLLFAHKSTRHFKKNGYKINLAVHSIFSHLFRKNKMSQQSTLEFHALLVALVLLTVFCPLPVVWPVMWCWFGASALSHAGFWHWLASAITMMLGDGFVVALLGNDVPLDMPGPPFPPLDMAGSPLPPVVDRIYRPASGDERMILSPEYQPAQLPQRNDDLDQMMLPSGMGGLLNDLRLPVPTFPGQQNDIELPGYQEVVLRYTQRLPPLWSALASATDSGDTLPPLQ